MEPEQSDNLLCLPFIRVTSAGLKQSTIKRYAQAQVRWQQWCSLRKVDWVDANDVELIAWLDTLKTPTAVDLALSALRWLQRRELVERGIVAIPYGARARPRLEAYLRMRFGSRQKRESRRAAALVLAALQRTLITTRESALLTRRAISLTRARELATRDAAILLIGWWASFRADDLQQLHWGDLVEEADGLRVTLRDSKGGAATVALVRRDDHPSLCPLAALAAYRELAFGTQEPDPEGRVFPPAQAIHRMVVRRTTAAGLRGRFTGHSMRAGFATEAAAQGVEDRLVRRHGRWLSADVHDIYVREGSLWRETPTRWIDLRAA